MMASDRFHADMTIGEASRMHPSAAEVFMSFHLGGCSHCSISEEETIGQVCAGYGVEVETLLETLNSLPKETGETASSEPPTR